LIRKLGLTLALGVLAALALAACGSSSSSSSTASTPASTSSGGSSTGASSGGGGGGGGGGGTIQVAADPSGALAYQQTKLTATAGSNTIDFTNDSSTPHNVTIEDSSGNSVGATDTVTGSNTSTTVDLKPGTYTYFCSVDGHEAAGMKGTLTVK
jgi:plastocyanin